MYTALGNLNQIWLVVMERSLSIKRLKRLLIPPEWKLNVLSENWHSMTLLKFSTFYCFYALKWTLYFQNSWFGLSLSSNTFLCVPYILLRRFIWLYECFCQYHLDKEYIQSAERRSSSQVSPFCNSYSISILRVYINVCYFPQHDLGVTYLIQDVLTPFEIPYTFIV